MIMGAAFPSKIDISFYDRPGWSSGSTNIVPTKRRRCIQLMLQDILSNALLQRLIISETSPTKVLLTLADLGRRSHFGFSLE